MDPKPLPSTAVVLGLAWILLSIGLETAPVAGQGSDGREAPVAYLIFAAGNVELSPRKPMSLGRAVPLAEHQLVGTAEDAWAIVEYRFATCDDAGGKSWQRASQRILLGPRGIHTVETPSSHCQVSSSRRLQQIFATLDDCDEGCNRRVTVVDASDAEAQGRAGKKAFRQLFDSSKFVDLANIQVDSERPVETRAQKTQALCSRYAASALAQMEENSTKGCGLSGSGWSEERKTHLDWCGAGSNKALDNLERRRASRRRILSRCKPRVDSTECGEFAAAAAEAQDDNLWQGCGLEGRAWTADFNTHYEWCTAGENRHRRQDELDKRRRQVEACD